MTVKRRSNSQDVADLASVSQASVSRAFTPGASISAKTKAKMGSRMARKSKMTKRMNPASKRLKMLNR